MAPIPSPPPEEKCRYSVGGLAATLLCALILPYYAHARDAVLQTPAVTVFYEHGAESAARDVEKEYAAVKTDLEKTLAWEIDFRPEIRFVRGRSAFRKMTGSDVVVAFAVPSQNLIVIDTARAYNNPYSLNATLKHEMCHLILHRNIKNENLPRWFDEGVCQWASGGVAELMSRNAGASAAQAAASGTLPALRDLITFPSDERSLILAYEESRSFVEYLVNQDGAKGLLKVLAFMKEGYSVDEALTKGLSRAAADIEMKWRAQLSGKETWFSYVSDNLYAFLFFLAALITVCGFIKVLKRKRDYVDEEEEGDGDNERGDWREPRS